jgi:hypothetical protein
MNGHRNPWLRQHELQLIEVANKNLYPSGRVIWAKINSSVAGHTPTSCQTHWNRTVKHTCTYDGKKWRMKQPNLFEGMKPQPKAESPKKTPQNASTGVLTKQVITKKSFLWGAFTFERYE